MKHFLLPPLIIGIIILFYSCSDKIEFHDENTVIDLHLPGISLYKTYNDYFDKVFARVDDDGKITFVYSYTDDHEFVTTDKKGKYQPAQRWKLKSGYTLAYDVWIEDAVTQYSFDEYINYINDNGKDFDKTNFFTITDRNPFSTFYWNKGNGAIQSITLGEVNEMIENKSIEDLFEKLK